MKIVRPFAGGVGGDFGRRCHKFWGLPKNVGSWSAKSPPT